MSPLRTWCARHWTTTSPAVGSRARRGLVSDAPESPPPAPVEDIASVAYAPVAQVTPHVITDGKLHVLLKRLADGCLRPREQANLEKVAQIVKYEQEGKTQKQIAALLGMTKPMFDQYLRSQSFRIYRRYCMEARRNQGNAELDANAQQRRQTMRRRFDLHDGDALDYFAYAFRRHTKIDVAKKIRVGDFIEPDRAERATKLVAGAQGWLEPIPAHAKPKDLTPGVVQAQMKAVRAADSREMVVRVTVGDATVEVGTREAARDAQAEEVG